MSKNSGVYTEYRYRKARAYVLSQSDICYLCGHGRADVAEHIVPVSKGGDPYDVANMRPAHGVRRCPTCGRNCNGEKSDKPLASVNQLKTSIDWYSESSR